MAVQSVDRFAERDEVDLASVAAALRRSWRAGLAGAVGCALVTLARLHGQASTYIFQMDVIAIMGSDVEMAAAAAPPSQQFFQPKLGTTTSAALFDVYLQSLRSRAVADELATCPAAMHSMFSDEWDGALMRWKEGTGRLFQLRHTVYRFLGWPSPPWEPPGGADVQKFLGRNLAVLRDSNEHLFSTLELETSRPEFAPQLLLLLHAAANDLLLPAAMNGRSARGTFTPAECQGQLHAGLRPGQSSDSVAARILGAPSMRPDPTNTPVKSILAALILGAAAGIGCRLSLQRLSARRL